MSRLRRFFVLAVSTVGVLAGMAGFASAAAPATGAAAEQLLTQTRWSAIQRVENAVALEPNRYAGVSTHGAGRLTIHLVDGQNLPAAELSGIQNPAISAGISVSVDHQKHSLAELTALQDSIPTAPLFTALGRQLSSWGINPDTNSVEVGVTRITLRLTADVQARYGNTVTLFTRPRPTPMVGRTTDIAPFYGGDLITDGQTNCTSGFTITNAYGWQYMLTAGHCFALGIGVVTNNTWMGNVSFRRYGGGNPDAALIGDGSYQGIIWIGSASNPTSIVVHSAANSCNGCQVYFDGAITGQSLATLVGNPYCVYTTDNAYICGVQETYSTNGNQNCAPGDSGGPVFAYDGRGGAIAVGIVTAGYTGTRCLYTRVPDILSIWQSTITVG